MANQVQVQFSASIKDLIDATERVKREIESIKDAAERVTEVFKKVAEAFGVAFSAEKIIEFVASMAEAGEQTERMAAILGESTKSVQELSFIAEITGGSTDQLALSMERLQVNLQKALTGTGPTAAALNALGLSAKELIALPIAEQMNRIADAVSKFADGGNKTAIVMELLGRGGAQMIPVLDKGREGLDELRQAADESGAVMSEKTVKAFSSLEHGLVTMKNAAKGLGGTLVGELAGGLTSASNAITQMMADMNATISGGALWERAMEDLRVVVSQLALEVLRLGVIAKDVFTLNWGDVSTHWQNGEKLIEEDLAAHAKRLEAIMAPARRAMQLALGGDEHSDKPQAPATNLGGGSKAGAADLDGQLKVLQLKFQATKDELDSEVKLFRISAADKFDILIGETEKEKQAELLLLSDKLGLYQRGSAQYEQVLAKMAETRQKYDNEEKKDLQQKTEEYAKTYQQVGSTVLGAWNSQLKGLLAGTTTFGQAMKNIFADLALKLIEYFEEIGVKWAASQLAMTVANTSGNAARLASDTATQAATLPVRAAKFVSDITADSAAVFGGIFANLAPLMGPAAAGPAAAGQAAVLGELASVPKLDTGGYVLSTGLAIIHAGERVQNASVVRDGGGGFGGDAHFHIHAWDTQTGFQAMLRQLPEFARELHRHMTRNPSFA